MTCQDCKNKDAEVHLTQIINNKKMEWNLCRDCAEKRGFHSPFEQVPFPLAEIVSGMVGNKVTVSKDKDGKKNVPSKKCPSCGMTFEDFGKVGRLGCGQCYRTFRTELSDLLRKIHGSHEHRGSVPSGQAETVSVKPFKEEKQLRDELKKAIESEDFEKAASLRDRIKKLTEKV